MKSKDNQNEQIDAILEKCKKVTYDIDNEITSSELLINQQQFLNNHSKALQSATNKYVNPFQNNQANLDNDISNNISLDQIDVMQYTLDPDLAKKTKNFTGNTKSKLIKEHNNDYSLDISQSFDDSSFLDALNPNKKQNFIELKYYDNFVMKLSSLDLVSLKIQNNPGDLFCIECKVPIFLNDSNFISGVSTNSSLIYDTFKVYSKLNDLVSNCIELEHSSIHKLNLNDSNFAALVNSNLYFSIYKISEKNTGKEKKGLSNNNIGTVSNKNPSNEMNLIGKSEIGMNKIFCAKEFYYDTNLEVISTLIKKKANNNKSKERAVSNNKQKTKLTNNNAKDKDKEEKVQEVVAYLKLACQLFTNQSSKEDDKKKINKKQEINNIEELNKVIKRSELNNNNENNNNNNKENTQQDQINNNNDFYDTYEKELQQALEKTGQQYVPADPYLSNNKNINRNIINYNNQSVIYKEIRVDVDDLLVIYLNISSIKYSLNSALETIISDKLRTRLNSVNNASKTTNLHNQNLNQIKKECEKFNLYITHKSFPSSESINSDVLWDINFNKSSNSITNYEDLNNRNDVDNILNNAHEIVNELSNNNNNINKKLINQYNEYINSLRDNQNFNFDYEYKMPFNLNETTIPLLEKGMFVLEVWDKSESKIDNLLGIIQLSMISVLEALTIGENLISISPISKNLLPLVLYDSYEPVYNLSLNQNLFYVKIDFGIGTNNQVHLFAKRILEKKKAEKKALDSLLLGMKEYYNNNINNKYAQSNLVSENNVVTSENNCNDDVYKDNNNNLQHQYVRTLNDDEISRIKNVMSLANNNSNNNNNNRFSPEIDAMQLLESNHEDIHNSIMNNSNINLNKNVVSSNNVSKYENPFEIGKTEYLNNNSNNNKQIKFNTTEGTFNPTINNNNIKNFPVLQITKQEACLNYNTNASKVAIGNTQNSNLAIIRTTHNYTNKNKARFNDINIGDAIFKEYKTYGEKKLYNKKNDWLSKSVQSSKSLKNYFSSKTITHIAAEMDNNEIKHQMAKSHTNKFLINQNRDNEELKDINNRALSMNSLNNYVDKDNKDFNSNIDNNNDDQSYSIKASNNADSEFNFKLSNNNVNNNLNNKNHSSNSVLTSNNKTKTNAKIFNEEGIKEVESFQDTSSIYDIKNNSRNKINSNSKNNSNNNTKKEIITNSNININTSENNLNSKDTRVSHYKHKFSITIIGIKNISYYILKQCKRIYFEYSFLNETIKSEFIDDLIVKYIENHNRNKSSINSINSLSLNLDFTSIHEILLNNFDSINKNNKILKDNINTDLEVLLKADIKESYLNKKINKEYNNDDETDNNESVSVVIGSGLFSIENILEVINKYDIDNTKSNNKNSSSMNNFIFLFGSKHINKENCVLGKANIQFSYSKEPQKLDNLNSNNTGLKDILLEKTLIYNKKLAKYSVLEIQLKNFSSNKRFLNLMNTEINNLEYYLESNPFANSQTKYALIYHIHRSRVIKGSLDCVLNNTHKIFLDLGASDLIEYLKTDCLFVNFYVKKKDNRSMKVNNDSNDNYNRTSNDYNYRNKAFLEDKHENIYFKTLNLADDNNNNSYNNDKNEKQNNSDNDKKITFREQFHILSDTSSNKETNNINSNVNYDNFKNKSKEEFEVKGKSKHSNLSLDKNFVFLAYGKLSLCDLLTQNEILKAKIHLYISHKHINKLRINENENNEENKIEIGTITVNVSLSQTTKQELEEYQQSLLNSNQIIKEKNNNYYNQVSSETNNTNDKSQIKNQNREKNNQKQRQILTLEKKISLLKNKNFSFIINIKDVLIQNSFMTNMISKFTRDLKTLNPEDISLFLSLNFLEKRKLSKFLNFSESFNMRIPVFNSNSSNVKNIDKRNYSIGGDNRNDCVLEKNMSSSFLINLFNFNLKDSFEVDCSEEDILFWFVESFIEVKMFIKLPNVSIDHNNYYNSGSHGFNAGLSGNLRMTSFNSGFGFNSNEKVFHLGSFFINPSACLGFDLQKINSNGKSDDDLNNCGSVFSSELSEICFYSSLLGDNKSYNEIRMFGSFTLIDKKCFDKKTISNENINSNSNSSNKDNSIEENSMLFKECYDIITIYKHNLNEYQSNSKHNRIKITNINNPDSNEVTISAHTIINLISVLSQDKLEVIINLHNRINQSQHQISELEYSEIIYLHNKIIEINNNTSNNDNINTIEEVYSSLSPITITKLSLLHKSLTSFIFNIDYNSNFSKLLSSESIDPIINKTDTLNNNDNSNTCSYLNIADKIFEMLINSNNSIKAINSNSFNTTNNVYLNSLNYKNNESKGNNYKDNNTIISNINKLELSSILSTMFRFSYSQNSDTQGSSFDYPPYNNLEQLIQALTILIFDLFSNNYYLINNELDIYSNSKISRKDSLDIIEVFYIIYTYSKFLSVTYNNNNEKILTSKLTMNTTTMTNNRNRNNNITNNINNIKNYNSNTNLINLEVFLKIESAKNLFLLNNNTVTNMLNLNQTATTKTKPNPYFRVTLNNKQMFISDYLIKTNYPSWIKEIPIIIPFDKDNTDTEIRLELFSKDLSKKDYCDSDVFLGEIIFNIFDIVKNNLLTSNLDYSRNNRNNMNNDNYINSGFTVIKEESDIILYNDLRNNEYLVNGRLGFEIKLSTSTFEIIRTIIDGIYSNNSNNSNNYVNNSYYEDKQIIDSENNNNNDYYNEADKNKGEVNESLNKYWQEIEIPDVSRDEMWKIINDNNKFIETITNKEKTANIEIKHCNKYENASDKAKSRSVSKSKPTNLLSYEEKVNNNNSNNNYNTISGFNKINNKENFFYNYSNSTALISNNMNSILKSNANSKSKSREVSPSYKEVLNQIYSNAESNSGISKNNNLRNYNDYSILNNNSNDNISAKISETLSKNPITNLNNSSFTAYNNSFKLKEASLPGVRAENSFLKRVQKIMKQSNKDNRDHSDSDN